MLGCDWSKSCHVTCTKPGYSLTAEYVFGLNNIALPVHILPPVTPLHNGPLYCQLSVAVAVVDVIRSIAKQIQLLA